MLDKFAVQARKKAHRDFTGMQIFCPVCQSILDCRKSTSFDVSKAEKLIFSKVICNKCFTPRRQEMIKAATGAGGTVEVYDGETGEYASIAPAGGDAK